MHGGEQALLDALVVAANDRFERRDHVADHILWRVMQQDREHGAVGGSRLDRCRDGVDEQAVLRYRENRRPLGLAVPARHPRQAVGDVLDLDVEGRWVEEIEAAPRQHALPGTWWRFARRHQGRPALPRAAHSLWRQQPTRWSLTMPTACMKAYTMVGPQKPKPASFSAFDILRDVSLSTGMSLRARNLFCCIVSPAMSHRNCEKPWRS